jgi:HD-GYP domain-containing protein (c-di-GMP phosphodiesterase class II)
MLRRVAPLLAGIATGALLVSQHKRRVAAERLAAAILETLLGAIDANDPETGAHVRRVARYALVIADAAELDERGSRNVERVALFHDIGKIDEALFDIIHDPTELSPEERRAITTHPEKGARVIAPLLAFYPELADGILSHHERWDGTGYPRRLAGEQIPLVARIITIADTFDAITHRRRYRDARDARAAGRVIARGRGTQFDPDLVDLFLLPPVFAEITREMRAAWSSPPQRAPESQAPSGVPDVSFRWRTVPAQPADH